MYVDALAKYRDARALFPSYKIDLNIGGVLDAMGRYTEAAVQFERFLISSRDAPELIIKAARERLTHLRTRLASVKVESLVQGAMINVSGKDAGKTPMDFPHYVSPGKHRVEVTKEGFLLSAEEVKLKPGQHVAQNVRLRSMAE